MALNDDIYVMRETVSRLTQMLAGRGLQVTQRGVEAFVESDVHGKPHLINLPYLPDNAPAELVDAIHGFLDHEVAHVLFTDFSLMGKMANDTAGMFNLIEDIRIEAAMARRFAGSAENLERTARFFLDKYTTPRYDAAQAAGNTRTAHGLLMVPLLRAMGGQRVFREFMNNPVYGAVMAPIMKRLQDFDGALAEVGKEHFTSAQAAKLAARIVDALRSPSPEKDSAPPPDDGEDHGEDDAPSDAPADNSADSAGEDDVIGDQAATPATDSGATTWSAMSEEIERGFTGGLIEEIHEAVVMAAHDADYLVYTKDRDVIAPLHVPSLYMPDMLTKLQTQADHLVAPMQKDLERAIAARSLTTWTPGQRHGRLHAANLSRLAFNDDRVFRVKTLASSKDVVVGLLIDASGSMRGPNIQLASMAAYALAQTLERIGIACEVMAHTTGGLVTDAPALLLEMKKIGRGFTRIESLYMPVLKTFAERMSTGVKERFAWLPHSALSNNVDGECVEVAGRRVLARREQGKILMVLSDGQPEAAGEPHLLGPHLKRVVGNLTHAGVTVVGIGINSTAVSSYYPKHLILNAIDELPALVMKQLKALIT